MIKLVLRLFALLVIPASSLNCGGGEPQSPSSWPSYLGDAKHANFAPGPELPAHPVVRTRWTKQFGDAISGQPVVANGLVYVGTWDGFVHALALDGKEQWVAYIGRFRLQGCQPESAGVTGTPTVTRIAAKSALVVGGGDGKLYALDALNGQTLWSSQIAATPPAFIWGSPLIFGTYVYIGIAAFGECSPAAGALVKAALATGLEVARWQTGCLGGGVWASPTIARSGRAIVFATGDRGQCGESAKAGPSVVVAGLESLAPIQQWSVPPIDQVTDGDFGATPIVLAVSWGMAEVELVGVANKNGTFYVLDTSHLDRGPLWSAQIAQGGECPYCGDGSIAPAAFDGKLLYVAGGRTSVRGKPCNGSLRSFRPTSPRPVWETCLPGVVLGGVLVTGNAAIVGAGSDLVAISTRSGKVLTSHHFAESVFLGSATAVRDHLLVGNINGRLYDLSVA